MRKGRPTKHKPLLGIESNGNDDEEEEEAEEERKNKSIKPKQKIHQKKDDEGDRDGRYVHFGWWNIIYSSFEVASNDWCDQMGEFVNRQNSLS